MGNNSTSIINDSQIKNAQKNVDKAAADYGNSQFSVSGDTVNYKNQLNKLGEYQSRYSNKIGDTLSNIEKGYDMNSDKLYQQYKQQYTREGLNASRDVSGQVASLNGGADSSMGRRQAAQAYYNYMQALNDKVPELANQWQQNQYNYLSALQSLDESDYNKYANNRDYYKDMFQWSYNNDVNMYQLTQEKLYNLLNQQNTNLSNTMSLKQFQAQMDQDAKQFGMEYALKKAESQAGIANTKANTENTRANTLAIKASLNQSGNSSSGGTTPKSKSSSGKSSTAGKASKKYLSLAQSITSYVDKGKNKKFKSEVEKAYKKGNITAKEKTSLLNTLNKATALNSKRNGAAKGASAGVSSTANKQNYNNIKKEVKKIIDNMPTNSVGYATDYIKQQYDKGKINKSQVGNLLDYIKII